MMLLLKFEVENSDETTLSMIIFTLLLPRYVNNTDHLVENTQNKVDNISDYHNYYSYKKLYCSLVMCVVGSGNAEMV